MYIVLAFASNWGMRQWMRPLCFFSNKVFFFFQIKILKKKTLKLLQCTFSSHVPFRVGAREGFPGAWELVPGWCKVSIFNFSIPGTLPTSCQPHWALLILECARHTRALTLTIASGTSSGCLRELLQHFLSAQEACVQCHLASRTFLVTYTKIVVFLIILSLYSVFVFMASAAAYKDTSKCSGKNWIKRSVYFVAKKIHT